MLLKKLAVFLLLPLYAYAQVSGTTKVTVPSSGIPSNAIFVFTGTSINDDDNHVLAPNITVTSWSQSGSVVSFVNSGTNNFTAGDWVTARFLTGWAPGLPTGMLLGTGHTLFQVLGTGLSATTFQFNVGSLTEGTCASSCGLVESAMNYIAASTTNRVIPCNRSQ